MSAAPSCSMPSKKAPAALVGQHLLGGVEQLHDAASGTQRHVAVESAPGILSSGWRKSEIRTRRAKRGSAATGGTGSRALPARSRPRTSWSMP